MLENQPSFAFHALNYAFQDFVNKSSDWKILCYKLCISDFCWFILTMKLSNPPELVLLYFRRKYLIKKIKIERKVYFPPTHTKKTFWERLLD